MARNIIEVLGQEEIAHLNKQIPAFGPGGTVAVSVTIRDGDHTRVQVYEGVVIAKRNRGLNSSFTVRKISSGEGVERTFQTYSPLVSAVEVKRRGAVRRAKLDYLRDRAGKTASIRELFSDAGRLGARIGQEIELARRESFLRAFFFRARGGCVPAGFCLFKRRTRYGSQPAEGRG